MAPERRAPRRPRVVFVTRKSPYELLLERWGTVGQAQFFLASRGERLEPLEEQHQAVRDAVASIDSALPPDQRRTRVDRDELDRFLFGPDDVVVVVGQDGLVPNAAKYLDGQPVVGVNPKPDTWDGVLCRHGAGAAVAAIRWTEHADGGAFCIEARAMALAEREDGMKLLALNEVYVGHRTHQSARYRLESDAVEERQSSSGLICATGTGMTGWARSIAQQRGLDVSELPRPEERSLAWFVREPFPSVSTGTDLDFGVVGEGEQLVVRSEMGAGGTVFADGIESDAIEFLEGRTLRVGLAAQSLRLVVPRR